MRTWISVYTYVCRRDDQTRGHKTEKAQFWYQFYFYNRNGYIEPISELV